MKNAMLLSRSERRGEENPTHNERLDISPWHERPSRSENKRRVNQKTLTAGIISLNLNLCCCAFVTVSEIWK